MNRSENDSDDQDEPVEVKIKKALEAYHATLDALENPKKMGREYGRGYVSLEGRAFLKYPSLYVQEDPFRPHR